MKHLRLFRRKLTMGLFCCC